MELNEKIREKQMSENFILGIMLALTGGFLDAYTYITRGGVFANAQYCSYGNKPCKRRF